MLLAGLEFRPHGGEFEASFSGGRAATQGEAEAQADEDGDDDQRGDHE